MADFTESAPDRNVQEGAPAFNGDLMSEVDNDMTVFLDNDLMSEFWSSLYKQLEEEEKESPCSSSRLDSEWGYVFQKEDTNKRKKMDVGSCSTGVYSYSDVSEALSAISSALSLSSDEKLTQIDPLDDFEMINPPNEILAESSCGDKGKTNGVNFLVPAVGMEFSSEEEVYEFYKTYAEQSGFFVRKGKVQRRYDGSIRKRYFFCSREGRKQDKETIYKRKETRTGCRARIACKLENEKWNISEFVSNHNHQLECAKISKIHVVNAEEKVGMPTEAIGTEPVECTEFGIQGHDEKVNVLDPLEAQCLMNYFNFLEQDRSFFSAVQHDDDCSAKNFFWTDGSSKINYKHFGDVLVLDTTIKMDNGVICALFLGLNHHREHVLFGCAFLLDETIQSLVWLLQNFMKAIDGAQPKTILTDESSIMGDAIKEVLPEANHHIGLWYVRRNAASFSKRCAKPGFQSLFDQWFFQHQTEEEFNSRWSSLLELFDLHDNPWLNILYTSREKWAPSFNKRTFNAGIEDTTSINGTFQSLTRHARTLASFVSEYLTLVFQLCKKEAFADFLCKEKVREILLNSDSVEQQAAGIYTYTMFKIFQKELVKCLLLEIEEIVGNETIAKFILTEEDGSHSTVEFNHLDFSAVCSCSKYESLGILCRHILKVFRERNVSQIPPKYILKRWTKFPKEDCALSNDMDAMICNQTSK